MVHEADRPLLRVIRYALLQVRAIHAEIGARGKQLHPDPNPYGIRMPTLAVAAEEVLLSKLNAWCSRGTRGVRVHGAHRGAVTIGDPAHILYSVYVDGINTAAAYLTPDDVENRGDYGTVIAVATGVNPTYNDVVMSYIQQHGSGRESRVLCRERGERPQVYDVAAAQSRPARGWYTHDTNDGIVCVDGSHPGMPLLFGEPLQHAGLGVAYTDSAASNAYDIITGGEVVASQMVGRAMAQLGSFGHGNIVIPALHHLATGVGGGVYAVAGGHSIGSELIDTYEQDTEAGFYLLAADQAVARLVLAAVQK